MALRQKIKLVQKTSSFAPPPAEGEVILAVRSAEGKPKKKSQKQIEREEIDAHIAEWQVQFNEDQKERMKILATLPF